MKIAFIATVCNEEKTIKPFLESVLAQSRPPEEIIIVDAGSTDGTLKILKKYQQKSSMIRIIELKNANRSIARNQAVKLAKNKLIAVTDAGCVADKHWLERITAPFADKAVLSVAGFYRPITNSLLQQAVAPFLAVMSDQFNPKTYLPSSRSLAFIKGTAWYPENLDYCEDLVLAQSLKEAGKMAVVPEALVYWQIPRSLRELYTRVKNYASGDVLAGWWPHLTKISTVYLRYILFYFFPPLFLAYLVWPIVKFNRYLKNPLGWLWLPLVQLTCDLAVLRGSLAGLKLRLGNKAFGG